MSNSPSKLPDLKELGQMSSKFFKALTSCVGEIVDDYKKKRQTVAPEKTEKASTTKRKVTKSKTAKPKTEKQLWPWPNGTKLRIFDLFIRDPFVPR